MEVLQSLVEFIALYMVIGTIMGVLFLLKTPIYSDKNTEYVASVNMLRSFIMIWPIHLCIYVGLKLYGVFRK